MAYLSFPVAFGDARKLGAVRDPVKEGQIRSRSQATNGSSAGGMG